MKIYEHGPFAVVTTDDNACIETADALAILPWKEAVGSAQAIIAENHRRKEEAAKRPKRWYVSLGDMSAQIAVDQSRGRKQDSIIMRSHDESAWFYVWAMNEKDAIERAREANHSFGVWVREYLA